MKFGLNSDNSEFNFTVEEVIKHPCATLQYFHTIYTLESIASHDELIEPDHLSDFLCNSILTVNVQILMGGRATLPVATVLLLFLICTQLQWQLASSTTTASPLSDDCFDGRSAWYRGNHATTRHGKTCQRWDTDVPHKNEYSLRSAHNYCRNPNNDPRGLWCYTTDKNTKRDYCNVPKCGGCIDGPSTWYRGNQSVTASGITCQRWDTNRPHKPKHIPKDGGHHNYCRNPDHDERGTWCYTILNNTRWSYCDIPKCPDDSLVTITHYDSSSESTQLLQFPADPEILKMQTDYTGTFNVSVIPGSKRSMTEYWALAADYKQQRLFFTDKTGDYLGVWDMAKKTVKKYFEGMAYGIENIAYDWVTENLYWTDSKFKWVMVSDKTFSYYTHIYKTAPDPAYGLAVHSVKRLIFFSTYKSLGSKIIMTDLAGKNPTILFMFPDVVDVTGITIDYTDDRLYWTDSTGYGGRVMSSLLDGTNKTQHIYKAGSIFWGVSAYLDYLFLSDIHSKEINGRKLYSVRLVSKKRKQVYLYIMGGGMPRGIAIYSRNEQFSPDTPPSFGSCEDSEVCSQICLPRINRKRVCSCSPGYHLDEVSNYCRMKLIEDEYLLIADAGQGKLFQVPITSRFDDTTKYSAVPAAKHLKDVNTAVSSEYVYWSDKKTSRIIRSKIDGTRSLVISMIYANSMAVDPYTGNLFYSDPERNTIVISNNDGAYSRTIVRPDPSKSLLTNIKMITLDTKYKKIYWTDTFSKKGEGQVLRCQYDGSEKEVVIDKLNWPHAITIDHDTNRLYVAEAKIAVIYEIELSDLVKIIDTSPKQKIYKLYDVSPFIRRINTDIVDLKVHQGMAYVLDGENNRLVRFNLTFGAPSMAPYGPAEFYRLTSLSVYSKSSFAKFMKQNNPCEYTMCREMCVALNESEARCVCGDDKFVVGHLCIRSSTDSTKRTSTTDGMINPTTSITRSAVTTTDTDMQFSTKSTAATKSASSVNGTSAALTISSTMFTTTSSEDCIGGIGVSYRGNRAVTRRGVACQRWDTDRPHMPKYKPIDGGHHNYCRNPNYDSSGTWCYTTESSIRWDYCDIAKCDSIPTTNVTTFDAPVKFNSTASSSKSSDTYTTSTPAKAMHLEIDNKAKKIPQIEEDPITERFVSLQVDENEATIEESQARFEFVEYEQRNVAAIP